jgi:predicted PurR-regulated permease PerM
MNSISMHVETFIRKYLIVVILSTLFITFITILVKFLYSKTLHKNHKFNVFLLLISSFGGVALAATLLLTIYYRQGDREEVAFQNYNTIWSKQNELIREFIEHPNMEYFYNDLYGESNKGRHYKRDIVMENNIFNMVMNDVSTVVAYLEAKRYSPSENTARVKDRFNKLLNLHVKSKYFLEYWKSYKKTVAPEILVKYMKDNYNI